MVSAAIAPETSVNAGVCSMVIAGLWVKPATTALSWITPAVVAAGNSPEPQPRRSCTMRVGKPPKLTLPFNHSDSPAESRSSVATGIGSPAGHAAGAMTCNDPPANADGASSTDRNGVCGGMPSSDPPRDESRTINRTTRESNNTPSASRLSTLSS